MIAFPSLSGIGIFVGVVLGLTFAVSIGLVCLDNYFQAKARARRLYRGSLQ